MCVCLFWDFFLVKSGWEADALVVWWPPMVYLCLFVGIFVYNFASFSTKRLELSVKDCLKIVSVGLVVSWEISLIHCWCKLSVKCLLLIPDFLKWYFLTCQVSVCIWICLRMMLAAFRLGAGQRRSNRVEACQKLKCFTYRNTLKGQGSRTPKETDPLGQTHLMMPAQCTRARQ